jgi:hypothetical protein
MTLLPTTNPLKTFCGHITEPRRAPSPGLKDRFLAKTQGRKEEHFGKRCVSNTLGDSIAKALRGTSETHFQGFYVTTQALSVRVKKNTDCHRFGGLSLFIFYYCKSAISWQNAPPNRQNE